MDTIIYGRLEKRNGTYETTNTSTQGGHRYACLAEDPVASTRNYGSGLKKPRPS